MTLLGKVALVTGAGRGIGNRIAYDLAHAGAKVIVHYATSRQGAEDLVARLREEGKEAAALRADISNVSEISNLIEESVSLFGRLDILVNNAAIDPIENFFDVSELLWDQVMDTNLKSVFFCSQYAAKEMLKAGRGRIINISSVHGQATMAGYAVYSASKGGINALTRQMALDLAKHGITVNAVAPGAVEVEKFIHEDWYDKEKIGRMIPVGRIGMPVDIAPIVVFLASEETGFITGQVITADGGTTTRLFL